MTHSVLEARKRPAQTMAKTIAPGDKPETGDIAPARVAVMVLGMHRSGTSALARVLSLLGCALPRHVLGANETQEAGHWESEVVRGFNDAVLREIGSDWSDWQPLPAGWSRSPLYAEQVARGRAVLREEFGEAGLFVLKDPRMCRMVGFWRDVLSAEGIWPSMVLPLRNPLEVADSLARRDGIDPAVGMLLWLRHVLDAEKATRGGARVICSYAALLENWAGVAARIEAGLGLGWARHPAAVDRDVRAFLQPGLRHHAHRTEAVMGNPLLSGWVREAYAILLRWDAQGEDSGDYAALDRIGAAFDEAAPAFAQPLLAGRDAQRHAADLAAQWAENRAFLEGRIAELQYDLAQADSARAVERAGLVQECDRLQGEIYAARAQGEAAQDALGSLQAWALDLEARAQAGERRALRAEREVAAADAGTARMTQQLEKAKGWVFRLAGERAAGERALQRVQARLGESAAARRMLEQRLRRAEADLAKLRAVEPMAVEDKSGEMADLRRALRGAEALRAQDGARIEQMQGEVAMLTQMLREVQDQAGEAGQRAGELEGRLRGAEAVRGELEQRLAERFAEMVTMTTALREQEAAARQASEQAEWLRAFAVMQVQRAGWWAWLPGAWARWWDRRALRARGLFDGQAYRARYEDVARSGVDPLRHFIVHGLAEGRTGGVA